MAKGSMVIAGNHNGWVLTPIDNLVRVDNTYTASFRVTEILGEPIVIGDKFEFKLSTSTSWDNEATYSFDYNRDNRTHTFTFDNQVELEINVNTWKVVRRIYLSFDNDWGMVTNSDVNMEMSYWDESNKEDRYVIMSKYIDANAEYGGGYFYYDIELFDPNHAIWFEFREAGIGNSHKFIKRIGFNPLTPHVVATDWEDNFTLQNSPE